MGATNDREARLAAALRENLKRRKQQSREREGPPADPAPGEADGSPAEENPGD